MDIEYFKRKAANYCSKREVCIFDLKKKFMSWQVDADFQSAIMNYLVDNKYIDEKRYAGAYVNDKYKFNHWGRNKIRYMLESMSIESKYIQEALTQIDDDEYLRILEKEALKKVATLKSDDSFELKQKATTFLASKGFEFDAIASVMDKVINKVLRKN